jgi:hypothetical protein
VILLGVLVAALVGMSRLNQAVAGWRYTVPADAGALLYASGFDSAEDWEEAEGRLSAQISDGVLRLEVGSEGSSLFAPLRWHMTDFDFTVDARAVAGPVNNGFGIIFRLADLNNYYYFLISSDGYYQLNRVQDGQARELSTWIPSEAVHFGIGEPNRIRVVGDGDQFRFYVNETPLAMCIPDDPDARSTYNEADGTCLGGQMLETVTDSAIPGGRLGVMAITFDQPDVVIAFDNAVIYSPTDASEESTANSGT